MERIFSNAHIVLEDEVIHGSLVLRDGKIADYANGGTSPPGTEDMGGDYLTPGLVEVHTDNVEKHFIPRPGVNWPSMPAMLAHDAAMASSGITTVFDAIAVGHDEGKEYRKDLCDEVVDTLTLAHEHGNLRSDHFLHLRCEISVPYMIEQFDRNAFNPRVKLVSIMDHTPGQRQWWNLDKYREFNMGKYGYSRAEMDAMIERRQVDQAKYAPPARAHITRFCQENRIPLASHDDATLDHVKEAVDDGVTIAEFPTTLEAAEASRQHGMMTVMGAPNMVRGGSHSGNVAAQTLAKQGLLDIFSSDYVPISLMEAAFLLHEKVGMPLAKAMATVSANPAKMLGLNDRGSIQPGKRADLVRVSYRDGAPLIREVVKAGERIA